MTLQGKISSLSPIFSFLWAGRYCKYFLINIFGFFRVTIRHEGFRGETRRFTLRIPSPALFCCISSLPHGTGQDATGSLHRAFGDGVPSRGNISSPVRSRSVRSKFQTLRSRQVYNRPCFLWTAMIPSALRLVICLLQFSQALLSISS